MAHMPTLRQLRHLVALHDAGHFGRAAQASHVTQSTLSASIKELETLLGVPLVDRTSRRVAFTPLGRAAVERARRLLVEAEELVQLAKSAAGPLAGPLRLGVIPTIGPFLLPVALPRLRRRFPRLRLYLREELTERLLEKLEGGELDVALVALPYDTGSAETMSLFEDRFVLACRKDHRLAQAQAVRSRDLAGESLLLLEEGHCLRGHALSACHLPGRGQGEVLEATSLHTLVQMVEGGLGVTLLPELAVRGGVLRGTSLVARPLADPADARRVALVWRRGTQRRNEFRLLGEELIAAHGKAHDAPGAGAAPRKVRKRARG
ncbi:MAG: hydrogen peroxide-inducible genes activator [Burkholderiales bacterium]|nr:hydrogen peroxide-inducible genes activator [Burkholderiales bacterium]